MVSIPCSQSRVISSPTSLFGLPRSVMSNSFVRSLFSWTIFSLLFVNNNKLSTQTVIISMEFPLRRI